jgi:hypothetical protein
MEDFVVGNGTRYKVQAVLDAVCDLGSVLMFYSHGETGTPREVYNLIMEAIADYSGDLKVMTMGAAIDYVRANGKLLSDRRTVVSTNLPDRADYRLRSNSPGYMKGNAAILTNYQDLFDLNGLKITDSDGRLATPRGKTSMGAFSHSLMIESGSLPATRKGQPFSFQLHAVGEDTSVEWTLTGASDSLPPGIELTGDGWLRGLPSESGEFGFSVKAQDNLGQVFVKTFTLLVKPEMLPPKLNMAKTSDGFQLEVSADPEDSFNVDSSTNLIDWLFFQSIPSTQSLQSLKGKYDLPQKYFRIRK